ncbi:MAG TPA: hypothetical protein VG621_00850 [Candidatus Paceibacterota bacterium]|nr:hypothetical protein [Candidatus Paceibacterota bacterium]
MNFTLAIQTLQALMIAASDEAKKSFQNAIEFLQSNGKKVIFRALNKLKLIGTHKLTTVEEFTVTDFFKEGKNGTTKVWLSDNFKSIILGAAPKKVSAAAETLDALQLTESMWDSQIVNELGNPTSYDIPTLLARLKQLVSAQSNGEAGTLLTNGYANIFYAKAADGRAVVVGALWDVGQWEFYCYEFDEDSEWLDGRLVFSPAIVEA